MAGALTIAKKVEPELAPRHDVFRAGAPCPIDPVHDENSPKHRIHSTRQGIYGPDRTITWRPWQQSPENEFRFRTGDRYLGRAVWEHYLGFEQNRSSSNAIKLSLIRLENQDVGEEAILQAGSRYAIFKVLNGTMTARKGVWSWIAQELPK
jgi:hypothetical protein